MKGRITFNELETLYEGHIGHDSILCTDSHKSYIQFANDLSFEHKRIKRGKHKEGIYHIQHINALHSNLKKWMNRFNGVATKYISNYIKWFKWLKLFDTEKEVIKAKNFIVQSNVTHSYNKVKDLKNRELMYI
jgi:transposase-like protein